MKYCGMAIRWFQDVTDGEEREVGKKGEALARLTEYGVNVPRGFVVTAPTFEEFVRSNGLESRIESILNNADRSDISSIRRAQDRIKDLIMNAELSDDVRDEIEEAYEKINMSEEVRNAGGEAVDLVGGQRETEFVAVRSSPTGSRIPGAHANALNVNGKNTVIKHIKECWASLYSTEALRVEDHIGSIHSMAVVVQRMVEPDVSGAAFSCDPLDPDRQRYVVEALWGLGTALFNGSSTPDRFAVDRNGNIRDRDVVNKEWKIVRDPTSGKNIKQRVSSEDRETPSIQSRDIEQVADTIQKLEGRFGNAFRLDFVLSRNRTYFLDVERFSPRSRKSGQPQHDRDRSGTGRDPFIAGRGASPGDVHGPVRILYNDMGIDTVSEEDIMAVVTASERLIAVLPDAAGFVADRGGLAANLSTLARRLDVPGVVGTENATDMLAQSDPVRINGGNGTVQENGVEQHTGSNGSSTTSTEMSVTDPDTLTATRVKVLGTEHMPSADGAVAPDYIDYNRARQVADQYQTGQVWLRTDAPGQALDEPFGVLVQHVQGEVNRQGTVISTYGGVMRSTNLFGRGIVFLGMDVDALKQDGDRESLRNSIQKIGVETPDGCESALLLRELDSELVQTAVEHGVDTIAVPPEHVEPTKQVVARAEKRLMLRKLREL